MLSLENANVPAAINKSKPNRTSGRRVKLNVRSPLSKNCLRIRAQRRALNEARLGPESPGASSIDVNGRHFPSEVQIGREPLTPSNVCRNARRGTGPAPFRHRSWQRRCRLESPAPPSGALEWAPRGFAAVRQATDRSPAWGNRVGLTPRPLLPVYPNQRTSQDRPDRSVCAITGSHQPVARMSEATSGNDRNAGPAFRVRSSGLRFSARRPRRHRGLELLAELGEFVGGDVADRPVVQPPVAPASDVESLDGVDLGRAAFGRGGLGDEQIDHMGTAAIDDGPGRAGIDIIDPATDQRKTLRR